MIISHDRRFIFVHCRKVAGSSMKVSLAPYLGRKDLVLGTLGATWDPRGLLDPRVAREVVTRDGLREFMRGVVYRRSWRSSLNKAVKRRFKRQYGLSSSAHAPATEVRRAFPEVWDTYFKFCFVRNPFERAVSDYLYLTRNDASPPSFSMYLRELERTSRDHHGRCKHDNFPLYSIDGAVAVDFVGHYENLAHDFEEVGRQLGISGLALTASEKRRDYVMPWRSYYKSGDQARVGRLFEKEIAAFNYSFYSTP